MNIQGGGLSFEISGTNKQLLQVLSESKKAIQNVQHGSSEGRQGYRKKSLKRRKRR